MSRTIKFRAWNKENEEYINGYDVLLRCDGSAISRYALGALDTDMPVNAIIEQYTGLKDKNGKEIYEGDIIRVSYGYNYEVRQFRTGAWRIGRDDLCVWADSSEVIGNVHENPELLGGEE